MKIIKRGQEPENKTAQTKCRKCGCQFEFQQQEGQLITDPRNECYVKIECPQCSNMCYVDALNFK